MVMTMHAQPEDIARLTRMLDTPNRVPAAEALLVLTRKE